MRHGIPVVNFKNIKEDAVSSFEDFDARSSYIHTFSCKDEDPNYKHKLAYHNSVEVNLHEITTGRDNVLSIASKLFPKHVSDETLYVDEETTYESVVELCKEKLRTRFDHHTLLSLITIIYGQGSAFNAKRQAVYKFCPYLRGKIKKEADIELHDLSSHLSMTDFEGHEDEVVALMSRGALGVSEQMENDYLYPDPDGGDFFWFRMQSSSSIHKSRLESDSISIMCSKLNFRWYANVSEDMDLKFRPSISSGSIKPDHEIKHDLDFLKVPYNTSTIPIKELELNMQELVDTGVSINFSVPGGSTPAVPAFYGVAYPQAMCCSMPSLANLSNQDLKMMLGNLNRHTTGNKSTLLSNLYDAIVDNYHDLEYSLSNVFAGMNCISYKINNTRYLGTKSNTIDMVKIINQSNKEQLLQSKLKNMNSTVASAIVALFVGMHTHNDVLFYPDKVNELYTPKGIISSSASYHATQLVPSAFTPVESKNKIHRQKSSKGENIAGVSIKEDVCPF